MDTMNIGLTEILSFAALIVSAFSMLYAKKQSDFAKRNHFNDYRSHLSQSHLAYRKALIKTQNKHKNDLLELSRLAGETLVKIVNHFDRYDTNQHAERYLRHLLHESSEMVFRTFQGQLAWQTSENISHRLYQISLKYHLEPNTYLEADLVNDTYFCNLVLEMKARLDQSKLQELMSNVQKEMINFNTLYNNLKANLTISANYLDELILQGNKEHFQLRESPQLYSEMKRTKTQLRTLGYINMPEGLDKSFSGKLYFSISKSIHLCALLHAIQCLHSWGWGYE